MPSELSCPAPVAVLTLASACLPAASGAGQRVGTVGLLHQAGLLALAASHGACWCFWPGSMGAACPQLALLSCAQAVWCLTLPLLLTAPCSHLPVLQRAGAGIKSLPRYSGEPSITLPGSCLPGASTLLAAPASLCLPCWGSWAGSCCPCTQPVVRLKVGSQQAYVYPSIRGGGRDGRQTYPVLMQTQTAPVASSCSPLWQVEVNMCQGDVCTCVWGGSLWQPSSATAQQLPLPPPLPATWAQGPLGPASHPECCTSTPCPGICVRALPKGGVRKGMGERTGQTTLVGAGHGQLLAGTGPSTLLVFVLLPAFPSQLPGS